MKVTRQFNLEKDTKNTGKYQEVAEGGAEVIGQLYVQKSAFTLGLPKTITVTVETVDTTEA